MTELDDSEIVREAWDDLVLDVCQRSADKVARTEHLTPRAARDWLIEAYIEGNCGLELILGVASIGSKEPTYFSAILVGTDVDCHGLKFTEPSE